MTALHHRTDCASGHTGQCDCGADKVAAFISRIANFTPGGRDPDDDALTINELREDARALLREPT